VDVLKQSWESGFFERFLEVLVPANELVEYFYILLDLIDLWRFRGVEDGERRDGGSIINVISARLE